MKSIAIAACLILTPVLVQAGETKFINRDGSSLSQLCVAAVTTDKPASALAQELSLDAGDVACNGRSLTSFVQQYRAQPYSAPLAFTQTNYVVSMGDQAPETLLCMAALKSEEEFAQVKAAHFGSNQNIEQSIRCNNLPLSSFVRKYRERTVSMLTTKAALI